MRVASRPSTTLTCRSTTGSSSCWSGRPGAARPRRCAWWPGWRRSRRARCGSVTGWLTVSRRASVTSPWSSRTTRFTPHLSVHENIGFALQSRKVAKAERDSKVRAAAAVLGLTGELDRKPRQLSGGQRQRVAMGRALVREPSVFLMDEPLSNLDAKLRIQMRSEVLRVHRRIGVATLYVTHDQTEAMTMGDRVAVLRSGTLQQCSAPRELYDSPANIFVATFIGSPSMNLYRAGPQSARRAGPRLAGSPRLRP